MNMEVKAEPALQLSASTLRIGGNAEIILCASLFYFRNPRAHWRERMEQLKAYGYNAIDVYFPWNFHESGEGIWDFSGEKDVEAFLQLAAEVGLWVVARPGPYICSEWDGGALPGYLFAKPGIVIRSTEAAYLKSVENWFDRILPILAKYEQQRGGSIICVQLENELDFYDCPDPNAYITALRDMAVSRGITAKLIACAGQGGLYEASGLVDGVAPTCNFYPNDMDPEFEAKVSAYESRLAELDLPLLVTETNRSHFLLRRLLSCGAKLLGPYLQVSGTNFGFTNGTNNWGKPLAFMTSDYDFYGMISPEGHVRSEAYEGRLMRRVINAYSSSLAEAVTAPASELATVVRSDRAATGTIAARQLRLKQGGQLLFSVNVGKQEEAVQFELSGEGLRVPQASRLTTVPGRCEILPIAVPLSAWGLEGTLNYATAELSDVLVADDGKKTIIVFHSEHEGEISLTLKQPIAAAEVEGMQKHEQQAEGTHLFTFAAAAGQIATSRLELADGHVIELVGLARADALLMDSHIHEGGYITIGSQIAYDDAPRDVAVNWSLKQVDAAAPLAAGSVYTPLADGADYLEKNGINRGYAWYEAVDQTLAGEQVQGVLVQQGSDVVSIYSDQAYLGSCVPGGGSRLIRTSEVQTGSKLTARVEIWGHTNFDDARLPALRLDSMKGIKGLTSVTKVQPLLHWRVLRTKPGTQPDLEFAAPDFNDSEWAIVTFGNWLSPDHPSAEYFRKTFTASESADSWTLHFGGIQAFAQVFVNGSAIGSVHPFDPYINISAYVRPGEDVQVTVFLERVLGLGAGEVILYEGNAAREWRLAASEEAELLGHAAQERTAAESHELPVRLEAGAVAWLYGKLDQPGEGNGWRVKVNGSNMKLTVFLGETIVGRLWTASGATRPSFSGGDQESFYLPGPWLNNGDQNELTILLEAVEAGEPALLESFTFLPVGILKG
ncbi:beta-galactosidase [Paenibacillus taihuensis]|uniref:Beta-galactosidase n=1 Tax=Paenibacillus taihuensis TaxID=1156355 RepID=A0A3D9R0K9_9BACL|nr:beta-galactosidase [Paenibacillus taihuensis]REE66981.1 beta-galactosidase [Paenibacillus taihuensis]